MYGIRCALPAVISLPLPAALLRTATTLHTLRSLAADRLHASVRRFCNETKMDEIELCNEVGEDDYECEVLIRARFHFRESDKMGRVTIAWVYLDTLDDLVGQATRRRKLKEHLDLEGISMFADVSARPARSTRMEGLKEGLSRKRRRSNRRQSAEPPRYIVLTACCA